MEPTVGKIIFFIVSSLLKTENDNLKKKKTYSNSKFLLNKGRIPAIAKIEEEEEIERKKRK